MVNRLVCFQGRISGLDFVDVSDGIVVLRDDELELEDCRLSAASSTQHISSGVETVVWTALGPKQTILSPSLHRVTEAPVARTVPVYSSA